MGLFGPKRTDPPTVAAARTVPQNGGPVLLGAGALAILGVTADPYNASPVTRAQAMSVPAFNSGVGQLCNLAGQLPLTADNPNGVSDETATFLRTLDPSMPVSWTKAKTIESLICHALSYWIITSRYANGFPRTIEYVDVEIMTERLQGRKVIGYEIGQGQDREVFNPADVIKFVGQRPGVLTAGAASIRTALANLHATRMIAEHPAPHMHLVDADGAEPLEADDATDYLTALTDAVASNGIAYLAGLNIVQNGWNARELQLVEARHADAVEMSRLLSLPTHYLAAPNQGSSLTYSNLTDVRRDKVDALASWAQAVEGRLSLPDVTPRGTTVTFDAASFVDQVTPDGVSSPPDPNPQPEVQP